ncbi:hypothetical protein A5821_002184 [Enterococcus sp. 7F3_DIV0205]|uniref:Uncharacterized protein n=1 Tax=Candidatus Enterococcus palustris TaxID=1834189 RepID=A0AAQ3WD33_9ENTE|nr:hypothetical protein [Enterococcus sp. 7F3_DIV0205]OTN82623.1 hypothetical protein A5821_002534 [Enterococcus sp. 7F3_DIV0205]
MRKQTAYIGLGCAILFFLLVISGCTKTSRYEHFSKADQTLSWTGNQTRSFGDSDNSGLKTEKDAFELIKEKYKLGIPAYYEETKKLLTKEIPSKEVQQRQTTYSVFAKNKELEFRTLYTFYKEKELQIIVEVTFNYTYSADRKEAYLKSQLINIKIAPINETLPNNNLADLIKGIGQNMKLAENKINSGLAGYEKKIKEDKEPVTADYLPVISNASGLKKEQEFLKEIAVVYDQNGTFRELYAEISDQK